MAPPDVRVGIKKSGANLGEHLEILGGNLLGNDFGSLHLHGDRPTVAEGSRVHLPERRRGNRHLCEVRKRLGNSHTQFGGDDFLHLSEGERFNAILKPREGFGRKAEAEDRNVQRESARASLT